MAETEVKWNQEVKELFERLMQNTPEMFRETASSAVKTQAEKYTQEQGSEFVTVDHLARACLTTAPPIFQAQIINDLKREGIDAEKYM